MATQEVFGTHRRVKVDQEELRNRADHFYSRARRNLGTLRLVSLSCCPVPALWSVCEIARSDPLARGPGLIREDIKRQARRLLQAGTENIFFERIWIQDYGTSSLSDFAAKYFEKILNKTAAR